jgi:hypothetical protein
VQGDARLISDITLVSKIAFNQRLGVFYCVYCCHLNQQNKEFASKQNFNNLMIKIYFPHTAQESLY